jgi:hypothetical protein
MNERLHRLSAKLDELIEFEEDRQRGKFKSGLLGAGLGAGTVGVGTGLYARGVRGALYAHGDPTAATARLVASRGIKGNIVAGAKLIPRDIEHHVVNPVGIGIGMAKIPAVRQAYAHDIRGAISRQFGRAARIIKP